MRESRTLLLILPGLFWPPWPLLPVPRRQTPGLLSLYIHLRIYPLAEWWSVREQSLQHRGSKSQRTATTCFSGPQQMKLELVELWGPKTPQYVLYNRKEKNDRDTLMRRQSEPGTPSDIWICILCTHSFTYTLTQTGYVKASKCTGVFTSKTRAAPATVCLVTQ